MKNYALLEYGAIHTEELTLPEAQEMLERHNRIFPNVQWDIAPMKETESRERLKGYLERQREIAVKYHS